MKLRQEINNTRDMIDGELKRTYLTKLLEKYPNAPLTDDGIPVGGCPHHFGLKDIDNCKKNRDCVKCWNQIVGRDKEKEYNSIAN